MNTEKIPKGYYCYDEKGKCPYWSIKEDLPKHENGYCSFLKESDYDINEKIGELECKNRKGEVTIIGPHEITTSLLWDQCKECDQNIEYERGEI